MNKQDQEIERIKHAYQSYSENPAILTNWSAYNPGNQAIISERRQALHNALKAASLLPLTSYKILEVGCGSGNVLGSLVDWGASPANLFGVDLLMERVEAAKQNYPDMYFQQANAEHLEFEDGKFDLLLFFTVFSSILDRKMAENVAQEANRVLKPGGAIIWYDFRYRNPNNPHTKPMPVVEIRHLFPAYKFYLRTVTLLPPLARHLGRLTPILYPLLATISPLRTHHLGLLIKPI